MRIFYYLATILISFQSLDLYCQVQSWHSTGLSDAWLSCVPTANPNNARGNSHWLKYDFGQVYRLTTSHFWNLNVPRRVNSYNNEAWSLTRLKGSPEDGVKDIIVDYSFDGVLWREWGRFALAKAPASPFYEGVSGPDFGGLQTRYLLFTMISNHGGSCYGMSEVRFDVQEAPSQLLESTKIQDILSVQPNPFSDECMVSLKGFPEGAVTMQLVDLTGRVLSEQGGYANGDGSPVLLRALDHPSGLYILKVLHEKAEASIQVEIIR